MDIAVQTNEQLGYFLFDDLHYLDLFVTCHGCLEPVQRNAAKGDLMNLVDKLSAEMK